MSLSVVTNPVGSGASKFFAGFQKCEFVFKREDLAVTDTESGLDANLQINHAGDLTSYLSVGDTIYIYSVGTNITYDGSFLITAIAAGEITIDTPFVEASTGGYINYFKNYHVELQCVHPTLPLYNLLPFTLQSDGDAAGNVVIDVSIVNELNIQRGEISEAFLSDSVTEFEVRYRQVYTGSAESFTLIDSKLVIMLFAIDEPEQDVILNQFDVPKLYLGYKGSLVIANAALPTSSTREMIYDELNINQVVVASGTLGSQDADVNGFLAWEWPAAASVSSTTKYIRFDVAGAGIFDYDPAGYDATDYLTS